MKYNNYHIPLQAPCVNPDMQSQKPGGPKRKEPKNCRACAPLKEAANAQFQLKAALKTRILCH